MSPENNSYQKKDGKKWLFLCAAVVLVYIALHIYLCSCHEAWRDEAQAWGIARSSTLTEIFGRLGADGHPVTVGDANLDVKLAVKLLNPYE